MKRAQRIQIPLFVITLFIVAMSAIRAIADPPSMPPDSRTSYW